MKKIFQDLTIILYICIKNIEDFHHSQKMSRTAHKYSSDVGKTKSLAEIMRIVENQANVPDEFTMITAEKKKKSGKESIDLTCCACKQSFHSQLDIRKQRPDRFNPSSLYTKKYASLTDLKEHGMYKHGKMCMVIPI